MAIMPPLHALHEEYGLIGMVATSFQAAGGAGQKGMDELIDQVPGLLADPAALARRGAEPVGLGIARDRAEAERYTEKVIASTDSAIRIQSTATITTPCSEDDASSR